MAQTITITLKNTHPTPISWPRITYRQLLGSLGYILEEVRLTTIKELNLPDFQVTKIMIDLAPFSGEKQLLWDHECIGCGRDSRLVKVSGHELGDPKDIVAWGCFAIGRTQCGA